MAWFRLRAPEVDAMRFDGSVDSAREIIEWARDQQPSVVVRQRIEYGGWQDDVGHIELEVRDHDQQVSDGDWLVLGGECGLPPVTVLTDGEFRRCYVAADAAAVD